LQRFDREWMDSQLRLGGRSWEPAFTPYTVRSGMSNDLTRSSVSL
jgi:hypothetical protein